MQLTLRSACTAQCAACCRSTGARSHQHWHNKMRTAVCKQGSACPPPGHHPQRMHPLTHAHLHCPLPPSQKAMQPPSENAMQQQQYRECTSGQCLKRLSGTRQRYTAVNTWRASLSHAGPHPTSCPTTHALSSLHPPRTCSSSSSSSSTLTLALAPLPSAPC
jgi:hypothetical protein